MKKGLAIGLVVVIAILATALWLGLNPPDRRAPSGGGTETAMELATPPVAGYEREEDAAFYPNEDDAEEGSSTAPAP